MTNGVPADVAQSIYDEIYDFANYAFNKAHAAAYAVVAYQTAWFKCRHPREYMAALLTSVLDSSEKVAEYIGECREMSIPASAPGHQRVSARFFRFLRGHPLRPGRPEGGGPVLYERNAEGTY